MSREPKCPIGSRWQNPKNGRIWIVVERYPFGRLMVQEEGRAYTGEPMQRDFITNNIRIEPKG
jgi:predicted type IV restriction endonuclease